MRARVRRLPGVVPALTYSPQTKTGIIASRLATDCSIPTRVVPWDTDGQVAERQLSFHSVSSRGLSLVRLCLFDEVADTRMR